MIQPRLASTLARQWLICQGRRPGKDFAPEGETAARLFAPPEQQLQPGRCRARYSSTLAGAWRLRSFTSCAARAVGSSAVSMGTATTRCAVARHSGHSIGAFRADIGRSALNGPQALQA
jgi:hypothetical protein